MSTDPDTIKAAAEQSVRYGAPFIASGVSAVFSDYMSTWPRVVATVGGGLAGVVLGPPMAQKFIDINASVRMEVAAGVLVAFVAMPLLRQVLEAFRSWRLADTAGWIFRAIVKRWLGVEPPPMPPPPDKEVPK